ncbi:hypothetical protein SAY87_008962 [Trapa incisa]|uniref:Uncharacterized protein n=1 Tax=Trapa incisa TaxID=236973 RepID=A0AAN7JUE7_9MYRT|nr:hypothetical protein SAY87_008962 [Trapa incisa]
MVMEVLVKPSRGPTVINGNSKEPREHGDAQSGNSAASIIFFQLAVQARPKGICHIQLSLCCNQIESLNHLRNCRNNGRRANLLP